VGQDSKRCFFFTASVNALKSNRLNKKITLHNLVPFYLFHTAFNEIQKQQFLLVLKQQMHL